LFLHLLYISFVNWVDITMRLAFVTICYMWPHLGPLYTRSQGQCWNQIQHSYWCKSWNQSQGFYPRCQGWNRKKTFPSASSSNKCWTLWPCFGPNAEKRIPSHMGGQFVTPGVNVVVFISNLGPIRNPKMLKVGPKFFWSCLLV
jgi:hypothetical protein